MLNKILLLAGLVAGVALFSLAAAPPPSEDLAALLQRQTQEMVDAIVPGNAAVWDRYLDPQAVYVTEDGTVLTKAEMVAQTKPMPTGVSGNIKVTDFKVADYGTVAIATYVDDEHETYHGHELHCQYRTTETWLKTPQGWRIIAGQVLALRTDPPDVPFKAAQRDEYAGRYALTPEITYEIRRQGDGLEGQQTGRKVEPLRAEAPDVLFVPGKPRYRKIFLRDAEGHVTGFAERREAWDLVWKRLP
ncbi:MAG TPA: nuclear transport factor 2 family protein [Thermoanaerobaculia bacterium]|nr:nuclear transport factor 2 family protein [Thermoanaerobaculia bacterium]